LSRLRERRVSLDYLLDVGLLLAVVALGLELTGHLVNEWLLDDRLSNLDAGEEANATTWASSAATFSAAYAAVLWLLAGARARAELLLLTAVVAFFSLDDIIQAHERLSEQLDVLESLPDYVRTRIWLPVYLPLLGLVGLLLWRAARDGPARAGRFVRAGLVLLVAGVALEVIGLSTKWLARRGTVWPDDIRVGLEESTELAGWILVAAGLTAAAVAAWQRLGVADH
jgi:hypothetical protein